MLLEAMQLFWICGRVAQLEERHAYTVDVTGSRPVTPEGVGSSPIGPARKSKGACLLRLPFFIRKSPGAHYR